MSTNIEQTTLYDITASGIDYSANIVKHSSPEHTSDKIYYIKRVLPYTTMDDLHQNLQNDYNPINFYRAIYLIALCKLIQYAIEVVQIMLQRRHI